MVVNLAQTVIGDLQQQQQQQQQQQAVVQQQQQPPHAIPLFEHPPPHQPNLALSELSDFNLLIVQEKCFFCIILLNFLVNWRLVK